MRVQKRDIRLKNIKYLLFLFEKSLPANVVASLVHFEAASEDEKQSSKSQRSDRAICLRLRAFSD
jgi:hypothetical protein